MLPSQYAERRRLGVWPLSRRAIDVSCCDSHCSGITPTSVRLYPGGHEASGASSYAALASLMPMQIPSAVDLCRPSPATDLHGRKGLVMTSNSDRRVP